jgi:predicted outer membrane repeat protein
MSAENLVIIGNHAETEGGGGAWFHDGAMTMMSGQIDENVSEGDAGGLKVTASSSNSASVWNTTFRGNHAVDDGGGIAVTNGGRVQLINVLVTGNLAEGEGGGIWSGGPDTTIKNGTFVANHAQMGAGGALFQSAGNVSVENTIIVSNDTNSQIIGFLPANVYFAIPGQVNVQYSAIQGAINSGNWDASAGNDGGNNTAEYCDMVSPGGGLTPHVSGNYHQTETSACLDIGSNGLNSVSEDLDGELRIQGTIDLGPYEFQPN